MKDKLKKSPQNRVKRQKDGKQERNKKKLEDCFKSFMNSKQHQENMEGKKIRGFKKISQNGRMSAN